MVKKAPQCIQLLVLKKWERVQEFAKEGMKWFATDKDNPVLASVETLHSEAEDKPCVVVRYYRRQPISPLTRNPHGGCAA